MNINFEEFTLSNGLNVILSCDNTVPTAAVNICYHVGSKNESPGKRGYAHLFEHLMFEGSKNIPQGDYDRLSLRAGCENNAYTTEDKTNYYILAPINQLETALWLESDRMLEFAVTEESLEIQKGVVIEEKKQVFDNRPYGTVSLEMAPLIYKNNGYSWDTIGDTEEIEKASIDDIREFYEQYYAPHNAVLTISGDLDIDKTILLTEKYFGSIIDSKKRVKNFCFEDNKLTGQNVKTIYDNIQLPGIFGVYKIPKENSPEFYAFDILTDILSTGESSRLYKELVYNKQLVSDIGCWVEGRECSGLLHFYAILLPGVSIDTVQKEIDLIINDVCIGNISEKEIAKVKNRIETRNIFKLQTNLSKADMLSHFKTFYNDPMLINTNTENYMGVTIDEIREYSEKYITNAGRVILNYLPKN